MIFILRTYGLPTPAWLALMIIGLYAGLAWWLHYKNRHILEESWWQDKVPYPTSSLEEVVRRAHEQDEKK